MNKLLRIGLILILALCYSCKEDEVEEVIVDVNKIEITPTSLSLLEAETNQLVVKILPENATDKTFVWSSSDETIATVSNEGLVTAIKEGNCNILATSDNEVKGTCEVIISKIKVNLDFTEAEIIEGKTKQLTATVTPETASNKDVKWTSSNDEIASVDQAGLITAIKIGEADIVATLVNGEKAICKINVITSDIAVTSIVLNKGASFTTKTDFVKFTAEVLPANATDKTVVWSTSNPDVGYLTKTGAWLGSAKGTTIIKATCSNGVFATCELTYDCTPVTGVTTVDEMTINLNEEVPFEYTILPENASNSWLLSNAEGGVVIGGDQEGLLFSTDLKKVSIMGVKVGDYTVTVKTEDGGFTSTTKVKVIDPAAPVVTSIRFDSPDIVDGVLNLYVGDQYVMPVITEPADIELGAGTFTRESTNPAVASWGGALIYADKVGETTMSITIINGGATASVKVIVKAKSPTTKCIDPNGKEYKTVKIGSQTWMAENYSYLPEVSNCKSSPSESTPKYYVLDYAGEDINEAMNTDNYKKYGVLYNYEAAKKNIPEGWHIPSDEEWQELETTIGMTSEQIKARGISRGEFASILKSKESWLSNGTDSFGFNALKAGSKMMSKTSNNSTVFWSSTNAASSRNYVRELHESQSFIDRGRGWLDLGFSVRYIQD